MRKRPSLQSLLIGVLLIALASLLYFDRWRNGGRPRLDSPAMVREIQQIQELGSVKYSVQKVVGFREEKVPFGSESLLLVVQGRVVAGIDFGELKPADIAKEDGEVFVRLPPAKILHVYIDEKQTKVWDRQVTWWTPWVAPNPDLERRARIEALKSVEETALEMGILADADRNARMALRNLLHAFGLERVRFQPLS